MLWPYHWRKAAPRIPWSNKSAQFTLWPYPGPSNATAASSQQYSIVVSVRIPPSVRFSHSNSNTYAPRSNLRRLSNAARLGCNGRAPCSSGPADKATKRCTTGPAATSNPAGVAPSGSLDRRGPAHNQGQLSQEAAGAPSYTEPYPPGKPRTWCDLLPKALWARRTSKHSAMGTSPCVLTYSHDIDKLMELEVRFLRVLKRLR
ncbi:unnamed protein product [Prunus brigantina]